MSDKKQIRYTFQGHTALLQQLDELEELLGRDDLTAELWHGRVEEKLELLREHLVQHYEWEESSKLYTSFPEANPQYQPAIEDLRREHKTTVLELDRLLELLGRGGPANQPREVIARSRDLIGVLRRHEDTEERIVAEAYSGGVVLEEHAEPVSDRKSRREMMEELDRGPGELDTDHVTVRTLTSDDLDWVVRIDKERAGRSRRAYYEVKMKEVAGDTGVRISLAAELEGDPAGFLMGRLYYGEFGLPEPVAILDTIAVAASAGGQRVGKALMRQLATNLRGLGIERVQTQVEWDQSELISFFKHMGFEPAPRLCLEMRLAR